MTKTCENCKHRGQETMADVGSCNCCEDFEFYIPDNEVTRDDTSQKDM